VLSNVDRIDVLSKCAGIVWVGTSEAYSVAQFERIRQTNLVGPFRFSRVVLLGMRSRRDGLLIKIISVSGRDAPLGFGIYAASKLGLEALTEVLGYEVSGLGIDPVIAEPEPFPGTHLSANQEDPGRSQL